MGYRAYGYGDLPREEEGAVCPLCGSGCERFFYRLGELIGCDACVEERDLPCPTYGERKGGWRDDEM